MNKYIPTIGIETHVQLKTKTKLFAAVGNDARGAEPNTLISHICFGMPGALPVLNKKAIELAVRAAYALQTEPEEFSKFDRKHYFYPDLPKGYQISQFKHPIIAGGKVDIDVDGESKTIGITRAHLEEDAGKNTHPPGKEYSLVDLNRVGTPLLEIVSEPEIHSPAEARAYVRELYLLMKYADVSDADLYHGNIRFDVNVSVSKDPKKLGIRTETKNLNSFKSVEKAIEYEIKRQSEMLDKGKEIIQETRGWDEAKQKTTEQRSKEEAHDYRYFPDPDIPPVVLDRKFTDPIKRSMPEMPRDIREEFKNIARVEMLLEYPDFVVAVRSTNEKAGEKAAIFASNMLVNVWLSQDSADQENFTFSVDNFIELYELVDSGELSSTNAKAIFLEAQGRRFKSIKEYAKANKYTQVSDEGEIIKIVQKVLKANSQAANDVKNGETKAIGFLVGQVMKESKGQANPQMAQDLIKKELGI